MRNSYLTIFLLINGVWLVFFSIFYLLFFEPEFTWAVDDIANVIFVVAIYGKYLMVTEDVLTWTLDDFALCLCRSFLSYPSKAL